MGNRLASIKSKLRQNEESILGFLNILCFYTIVVTSLMNNLRYSSLLFEFESNDSWHSIVWIIGLLIISVLTAISCYRGAEKKYLSIASIYSHILLLNYYNLYSIMSFNSIENYRIVNFLLWWLALLTTLRYIHIALQKKEIYIIYSHLLINLINIVRHFK
jgi:hypothetical protein